MDPTELAARLKAAHDGALRSDAWHAVAAEVARIIAEREAPLVDYALFVEQYAVDYWDIDELRAYRGVAFEERIPA